MSAPKRYKLIGVLYRECMGRSDPRFPGPLAGPLYCEPCMKALQCAASPIVGRLGDENGSVDGDGCHESYDSRTGLVYDWLHTPYDAAQRPFIKSRLKRGHNQRAGLPYLSTLDQPGFRPFLVRIGRIWNGPSYWSSGSRSRTTLRVPDRSKPREWCRYEHGTQKNPARPDEKGYWKIFYKDVPYPSRHQRLYAFRDLVEAKAFIKVKALGHSFDVHRFRDGTGAGASTPSQRHEAVRKFAAHLEYVFWDWARLSKRACTEPVDDWEKDFS